MISVVATITVKAEHKEEFIRIFCANVPAVLAEDGCIEYFPAIDTNSGIEIQSSSDNEVVVLEKWESIDALKAHLTAPHMEKFRSDTDGMVEGLNLRVLEKVE